MAGIIYSRAEKDSCLQLDRPISNLIEILDKAVISVESKACLDLVSSSMKWDIILFSILRMKNNFLKIVYYLESAW